MATRLNMTMVILATATTMAALATACSSEDPSPRPTSSSGSSGQASSSLSLGFASKCARCHGTTATGQGIYPPLPGLLTAAEYAATVRSGRDEMPSFDTSQVSDADLAADFDWMKTKR